MILKFELGLTWNFKIFKTIFCQIYNIQIVVKCLLELSFIFLRCKSSFSNKTISLKLIFNVWFESARLDVRSRNFEIPSIKARNRGQPGERPF